MLLLDILMLVVGSLLALTLRPTLLRTLAAGLTLVVLICLIVLAVNGFPLMRKRVGRRDVPLAPPAASTALTAHRALGFVTEAVFSLGWPCLVGLSFRVAASWLRRVLSVVVAVSLFAVFALVAVSAYMLPAIGSATLPPPLAASILRFAIFHVTFGPAVAALLLLTLAFLVLRQSRVAAV